MTSHRPRAGLARDSPRMGGNAVPHGARRKDAMRRTLAEHQRAVEQVLSDAWALVTRNPAVELLPVGETQGRVLAADLVAPLDLPPFANSQMDGYAIHVSDAVGDQSNAVDLPKSTTYVVAETIAAGAVPARLEASTAAAIMTGAMMPAGANAVVPIERAVPAHFAVAGESVTLPSTPAGSYVRLQGSDIESGSSVIAAGTLLNPAHLGLAAALGLTELPVRRRLKALLISTGDEVLAPGDPAAADGLPLGKIFDANQAMLKAALEQAQVEVSRPERVSDDPATLWQLMDTSTRRSHDDGEGTGTDDGEDTGTGAGDGTGGSAYDLLITVGGISAGAFEVVKQAVDLAGSRASVDFLSVAMQPGGPQGLGTVNGVPFIGFPGNPVSSFVSFEIFLRPALSALVGAPAPRQRVVAVLETAMSSPAGKHQLRRGIYSGPEFESAPSVREVGGESSHLLGALANANALIHLPAGVTELQAGAKVEVWLL